jgi:hypothetical protein
MVYRAARQWLHQPAAHNRDIRSGLLLKLALLDRVGVDPGELLRAQRTQLTPVAAALASRVPAAGGYDRTLTLWRSESISATLRFLDTLLAGTPPMPVMVPPTAVPGRSRPPLAG